MVDYLCALLKGTYSMAVKKKPPTLNIEKEAKDFVKTKKVMTKSIPETSSSPPRVQLAASVLAGLIANSGRSKAEELVEEAFRYVDLILKYKD
tara:strand:- start:3509 stop:3787 length:279 start_codon:yes stop_codon:yes gene_type:complete